MPGKQPAFAVLGVQNETDAQSLVGRLSAPVKVPREHDFGIDFFCQLYTPMGTKSVSVDDVFTLQVKGMREVLRFGGIRDGQWRDYEISWLRTIASPLFLARVQGTQPTLDLYSLAPIWRVLWQAASPFEILCATDPPSDTVYQRKEIEWLDSGEQSGDGRAWSVPVGPPFLRLTHAALADDAWRSNAANLLRRHIQIERQNLLMFHLRVAIHECLEVWTTNSFVDPVVLSKAALGPVAVNLGAHLQWQNDRDAYRLIDVLEWLDQRGALDPLGRGLLEGLRATRNLGLGPSERLSSGP